ncbi:MAG: hypothetical protein R3185_05605 [Candidatus Thermoplasmatota archaeon]|nr:hypothetical protein [Candidatus Thermoplasmatota archaeon]
MRWLLLASLAVFLILPASASAGLPATETDGTGTAELTWLYAHWPASIGEAQRAPIPMDEIYPDEEPDLSEGPGLPATSLTGQVPQFTYQLTDFFGNVGPMGTLHMDTGQPAVLRFYMSADQTPWPSAAGAPPEDLDHGVAPRVTVQARLLTTQTLVGHGSLTQDLVSLPEELGQGVHTFEVPITLEANQVPARSGLRVEISIHQVDQAGVRATQPLYNVHTGEQHPTGLALPLMNPEGLLLEDGARDEPLAVQAVRDPGGLDDEDRELVRMGASGTLGAALATAMVSLVQLGRRFLG